MLHGAASERQLEVPGELLGWAGVCQRLATRVLTAVAKSCVEQPRQEQKSARTALKSKEVCHLIQQAAQEGGGQG